MRHPKMAAPINMRVSWCLTKTFLRHSRLKRVSAFYYRYRSTYGHNDEQNKETHFGFDYIPEHEKEEKVYQVFENVASSYDVMNDTMSVGVHRLWKDCFMEKMAPVSGTKLLDVAGGTGDIAFRFLHYIQLEKSRNSKASQDFNIEMPREVEAQVYMDPAESLSDSSSSSDEETTKGRELCVTVCDINQAMLDVGRERAKGSGYDKEISWVKGNAEDLPLEDDTYDVYTIAFGIRNCTHIDRVLQEAHRVLKPGGRFMCLEFSHVNNPLLRMMYDSYSFQVIPVMGQVIAGDWKSYQYLVESIRQFPKQEEFAAMMRQAKFRMVTYENLTFGIAAIHSGFKIA